MHVDTGLGKLDHHQLEEITSAAERCFEFIKKERKGEPFKKVDEKALIQIIKVVTEIDNARDLNWPEAENYRYNFYLHDLIAGIRGMAGSDEEAMNFGLKESEWSNPLSVSIPKSKSLTYDSLLLRFLENHPTLLSILQILFKLLHPYN